MKKTDNIFSLRMRRLKASFKDHFHLLFKSAAHNHLRFQQIKHSKGGEDFSTVSFSSYTELKQYQKKTRIFGSGLSTALAVFVVGLAALPTFFAPSGSRAAVAPAITSVSPSLGPTSGGTGITITGTNFSPLAENAGGSASWTDTGVSLPSRVTAAQTAVIGGYVYIFGGYYGNTFYNTIYRAPVNDPTNFSDTGKTLPGVLAASQLAVVGNTIYLFGGQTGSSTYTNVIYSASVSDPTTWINTGKLLPSNVGYSQVAVIGDYVYLFGGYLGGTTGQDIIYRAPISDPTTWSNTGKFLPGKLGLSQLAVIDNYVYLFGGLVSGGSTYTNVIYRAAVSDPTTWSNTGSTIPNQILGAQLAIIGDSIYLYGGYKTSSLNTIYFAPITNPTTWSNTGNVLPVGVEASNLLVVGSNVYLYGGYTTADVTNIWKAPVQQNRPNKYMPSWKTDWQTYANLGAQSANVTIGGVQVLNNQYLNSNTIALLTPAHSVGAVDVIVTNPDAQSATLTNGFTYTNTAAPTVSSISPNYGAIAGGTNVTVTGTNFSLADANTNFLLHADGSGASFVDAAKGKTISVFGNTTQSATQSKFGGKSAYFDGTGDFLQVPDSDDWDFGSGNFTVDLWAARTVTGARQYLIDQTDNVGANVNTSFMLEYTAANTLQVTVMNANTPLTNYIQTTSTATVTDNNWHHVALVRNGTNLNVYLDGVSVISTTINFTINPSAQPLTLGSLSTMGLLLTGYIDEVRVSKGIARWTSNFSVPIAPYYVPVVTVGGNQITNVLNTSSTTLNFVTPAHVAGAVDVTVTNPDSQSVTSTNGFTYGELPPSITSILPTSGSTNGGTNITVVGANFNGGIDSNTKLILHGDGTGSSIVDSSITPKTLTVSGATQSATQSKFGGKSILFASGQYVSAATSTDFEFTGDYTVDAWIYPTATPSVTGEIVDYGTHAGGSAFWDFRVENNNTITVSLYNGSGYLYSLTSSSAVSLNNWTHVAAVRSGNNIYMFFNGTSVGSATYTGNYFPTGKTLMIGRHASTTTQYFPGYIDEFRITKGVALWTSNFTVPSVPYMVPNLKMGGTQVTNILTGSSTNITATTPAHVAGTVDVTLANYDNQTSTLTNGYTYIVPPTISSIIPTSGLKTGGDSVTISGSNFYGTPTVTLGGTNATNVTLVNSTTITATTPAHNVGVVDVVVTNPDSQSYTLTNGFTYSDPSPSITSITPNFGSAAGGTNVTVMGSNFSFADSHTSLLLHGNGNGSSIIDSSYSPKVITVAGATTQSISQSKFGGSSIYFGGSGNYLSVPSGNDFNFGSGDFTIDFWTYFQKSQNAAAAFVCMGSPSLCIYNYNANSTFDVSYNGTDIISTPNSNAPDNTWFHVALVRNSGTLTLYINGVSKGSTTFTTAIGATGNFYLSTISGSSYYLTGYMDEVRVSKGLARWNNNFTPSATQYFTPSISLGNAQATNVIAISPTSFSATTAPHVAGSVDAVVTNPDSQSATLTNGYTYTAPPTVSSITPNNGLKTGGDSVTITGANFYGNPTVTLGGTSATNINVVNSTTITVTTAAHSTGRVDVVVTNPDLQSATLANGFIYSELPISISSISPNSGPIMGGTNVTITGSNFVPNDFGMGTDGSVTISSNTNINTTAISAGRTCADAVNYSISSLNSSTATLSSSPSAGCLAAGDEILLMNLQGTKTNYVNVGNYETLRIQSIAANVITFASPKAKFYGNNSNDDSNIGTATTNQRVMLQRVPNYTNVTINSGVTLTGNAWDGTFGGIVFFKASGIITNNGIISMNGNGYRGGPWTAGDPGSWQPSNQGESYGGLGIASTAANFGGGGSGTKQSGSNGTNGGGGGYGTAGTNATGIGGLVYGSSSLNNIYPGSGGGPTYGQAGANGGGIVMISASALQGSGTITSKGNNGTGDSRGYGSGGGSGGSIYLKVANGTLGSSLVNASGGTGSIYGGGAGGSGRIAVYYTSSISGTTTPSAYQAAATLNNLWLTLGGFSATNIVYLNQNTITATTPAHSAGPVDVVLLNGDGQSSTLNNGFTYVGPPTVSLVSPSSVTNNQSVNGISISGVGFQNGATVKFKLAGETDVVCANVVFNSATSLSCDGDFHGIKPGNWNVEVTNADTQVGSGAGLLNVIGEVTQIKFYTPSYTIKPNVASQAIRIQLQDSAGRPAKPQSTSTIDLNKTSSTGEFSLSRTSWSPISSITFANTEDTKVVYYKDSTLGTYTIGASENPSNNWTDASQSIIVSNSAPYVWPFDVSSDYQYDGVKISVTNSDASLTDLSATGSTIANVSSAALTYSSLTSFSEVLDSDNQGSVKYQLSNNNGTTWYWWNGTTWVSTTQGIAQANDATTINAHISTFNSAIGQIGNAKLSFRAYLIGSGSQKVSLDSVFVGYTLYPYKYSFISKPASLNETEEGTFVVQAQDQLGNVITVDHDTVVTLSTSTPGTGFFATNLSEDISTRWDKTTVTIPSGQNSATFYYKDSTKGSKTISANPPAGESSVAATYSLTVKSRYRFLVTGVSDPIKAGVPSSITVQAADYLGNPVTNYTGTIHFSSSDLASTLPADNTLTSAMLGTKTYVNGVTMMTQAEQCVTVTDTLDSNITGSQCNITVGAAPAGVASKLKIISTSQYVPVGNVSSAITVQLQDVNGDAAVKATSTTVYVYRTTATGQFSANGTTGWNSGAFSVTIPAGVTSANFYYKDSAIGNYNLTVADDAVQGQDLGLTNDSQVLAAVAGDPYSFSYNSGSTYIVAGSTTGALNYSLHDSLGNTVTTSNNQAVIISVTGGEISLDGLTNWSSKLNTTISTGNFDGNFYYRNNTAGTYSLAISDSDPANGNTGLIDVNTSLVVHGAGAAGFAFLNSPININVGDISTALTVQLRDTYGNVAVSGSDTKIYLYSDKAGTTFSAASSPFVSVSYITIPTGSSNGTFYIKQSADNGSITITASDNNSAPDGNAGLADAAQTETVSQGNVTNFVIANASPLNVVAGEESAVIKVESRNSFGVKTPLAADKTIYFYTNSGSSLKEFSLNASPSWNSVTSVTWPSGTDTLNFYYKDTQAGSKVITVSDDAVSSQDNGITNSDLNVQINPATLTKVKITSAALTKEAGERGQMTVELEDQYGNAVNAPSDKTVNLSATSGIFTDQAGNAINNLVINSGSSAKDFYYQNDAVGTYNVTVQADGLTSDSQNFVVINGLPVVAKLSIVDNNVEAGAVSGKIQVKLYNAHNVVTIATTDANITITTNSASGKFDINANGSFASNTLTLLIPAGSSLQEFYYKDTKAGTARLYSNGTGLTEGALDINITVGAIDHLKFTTSSQTITKDNISSNISGKIYDQYENEITLSSDLVLNLATTSLGGEFSALASPWNSITSLTIPSGQNAFGFYYKDSNVNVAQITVSSSYGNITQTENIISGPLKDVTPVKLLFQTPSQTLTINSAATFEFYLADSTDAYTMAQGSMTATVTSNSATGTFFNGSSWVSSLNIDFAKGDSVKTFQYRDGSSGAPVITIASAGLTFAAQQENVVNGNIEKIVLEAADNAHTVDMIPVTIKTMTNSDLPVAVTSNKSITLTHNGTGHFYSDGAGQNRISSITILAGSSSKVVYYHQTTVGAVTFGADESPSLGWTAGQKDISINSLPSRFRFTTGVQTKQAGTTSDVMTVTMDDIYGNVSNAQTDLVLHLSSSSAYGEFSVSNTTWSNTTTVTMASGTNSASFYYRDTLAGTQSITVSDVSTPAENPDSGLANAQQNFIVSASDIFSLNILSGVNNLEIGQVSSPITVQAQDQYGNAKIMNNDFAVYLYSNSTAGKFAANSSFASLITSAKILAGTSSATFYYKDMNVGNFEITVSDKNVLDNPDSGIVNDKQAVNVIRGNVAKITWETATATIEEGDTNGLFTVKTTNSSGTEISVDNDLTLYLTIKYTTSGNGTFGSSSTGPWGITSVTIPAGSSRASFYYKDTIAGSPRIKVSDEQNPVDSSDSGLSNAATYVNVVKGAISKIVFESNSQSVVANHPSGIFQIRTVNKSDVPTKVGSDKVLYVRSSSATGEFSQDGINWGINGIIISSGNDSGIFYYRDETSGTYNLTVSDNLPLVPDTNWTNALQQITVNPQQLDHFSVRNISDPQTQGTPSSLVVSPVDSENYVIKEYIGTITEIKALNAVGDVESAILPDLPYTFVPSVDKGLKTFTNSVAFLSSGEKTVTVMDNNGFTGSQQNITVVAASTNPIAKVRFIGTSSPLDIVKRTPTLITAQLQDSSGNPVNTSSAAGYDLKVTSGNGELSIDGNNWSQEITINVKQYLNYANFYYRNSVKTTDKLSLADWNGGIDNSAIDNDSLDINVTASVATELQVTGLASQIAGEQQEITITAKDSDGDIDTSYEGNKDIIFAGANSAVTGQNPNCGDKFGNEIEFGNITTLNFNKGEAKCKLKLYRKEIAEIKADTGSINSGSNGNLTINVLANVMDRNNSVLNASPNPQTTGAPVLVSVLPKDAYGNNTSQSAFEVAFSVSGANTVSKQALVFNSASQIYKYSYTPMIPGEDVVSATLNDLAIKQDGEGQSDGIVHEKIEGEAIASECNYISLNSDSTNGKLVYDACIGQDQEVKSAKLSKSETKDTSVSQLSLVTKDGISNFSGKVEVQSSDNKFSGQSFDSKYLDADKFTPHVFLKISSDDDNDKIKRTTLRIIIANKWLSENSITNVFAIDSEGNNIEANKVDESNDNTVFEITASGLPQYLAIFGQKEEVVVVDTEVKDESGKTDGDIVTVIDKVFDYPIGTIQNKSREDNNEKNEIVSDTIAKLFGLDQKNAAELINTLALISTSAAAVSVGVATAASFPMLSYALGAMRTATAIPYRRKQKWGVVYDSETGDPLASALVIISDGEGKVKEMKNTDQSGFYSFLAPQGTYVIDVKKSGYLPALNSHVVSFETYYDNSYICGEKIKLEEEEIISLNIPMIKQTETFVHKIFNPATLTHAIFWTGFCFSIFALAITPNYLNIAILVFFILNFLFNTFYKQNLRAGKVLNKEMKPVGFATVKIFDKIDGKLLARTITNEKGSFALVMNEGEYVIEVQSGTIITRKEITLLQHQEIKEKIILTDEV